MENDEEVNNRGDISNSLAEKLARMRECMQTLADIKIVFNYNTQKAKELEKKLEDQINRKQYSGNNEVKRSLTSEHRFNTFLINRIEENLKKKHKST